jgi:hypothetical protein
MAITPSPQQARNQEITYYASILAKLPGTYKGNLKQYDGETWSSLYKKLARKYPSVDVQQLADAVLGIEAAQKLGTDVAGSDAQLSKFLNATGPSIEQGIAKVPGVSVLSGIGAVGQFFNDLRDPTVWIRVGKILVGGVLLLVGLAKMTGFDKGIAGKAVKVAPLL